MAYLYETHLHTCESSRCGVSSGAKQARFYHSIGYTGIIVTDHFYGGNTRIDRALPWEQFVDEFWKGYEAAKAEGDRIGLDVFPGYEQNYEGDEYLVYGLSKAYMKAHPEMPFWTRRQQLAEVHAAGGCVIQAHPFRIRDYMEAIRLAPLFCDGVELANSANEAIEDMRCAHYARDHGFIGTAGSDNHRSPTKEAPFGIALTKKMTDIRDLVKLIRSHTPIELSVPENRFLPQGSLPDERHRALILDENEVSKPSPKQWWE